MFTYILLSLVSIAYLLYIYFTRTFTYWKSRNITGPEPVVFFGNIKESALRRKNIGIIFKKIYDNYSKEKVVGVYRMTTPCLLIRDLDIVKRVMIKDFDLFIDRGVEFSKEGLGANLFHADGDTWQALRNRFTPLFTSGKLKNMLHLMLDRGDKFASYVDSICDTQPEQEVHSLVQKFTMATIAACAFGVEIDNLQDKLDTLHYIDKVTFTPNYANELDMMYPGILKRLNSSLIPKVVRDFFYDLVKTVISERGGMPSNRKDFMDLILQLRQQGQIETTKRNDHNHKHILELSEGIIAAQAFVFYVAGYETSATTMSFLLYELAVNPHVQDKVLAEIDSVLANANGVIDYDVLMSLQYLDKVMQETLRMYPLVEPLQRNAKVDYTIPGTDVTVKKGMTVLISPMGIHHDEAYYTNPEVFDPERFNPENSGNRHPCAYIPFGTGPRNCIGMRFAKVQILVCLVKLLSKFRVEKSKNTVPVMEFEPNRNLIGPKGGVHLKIVRRQPVK